MRIRTSLLLLMCLWALSGFGQVNFSYIPVSLNASFFQSEDRMVAALQINNYGIHGSYARQWKNKMLLLGIQHNNGQIAFDPHNFWKNVDIDPTERLHLIQALPIRMLYTEVAVGYNMYFHAGKLGMSTGIGREFLRNNNRLFFQLDWSNESRYINAGISMRGNYSYVRDTPMGTLEPMVTAKIKLGELCLVNQFGYSVVLKRGEAYMKPVFTLGFNWVW